MTMSKKLKDSYQNMMWKKLLHIAPRSLAEKSLTEEYENINLDLATVIS